MIVIQRADMKTTQEDADNHHFCSTDGSDSKGKSEGYFCDHTDVFVFFPISLTCMKA